MTGERIRHSDRNVLRAGLQEPAISTPFSRSPRTEEHAALFERLFEGTLSPDEQQAVQSRLRVDDCFRTAYLHWSNYVSDLEVLFQEEELRARAVQAGQRPRRSSRTAIALAGLSLAILAGLAGYLLSGLSAGRQALPAIASGEAPAPPEREPDRARESAPVRPDEGAEPLPRTGSLAVIVAAEEASRHAVGQRLAAGPVSLESGRLLMVFLSGAHLYLEGPAELILESTNSARLVHGQAAIRDANNSKPFRLNVPEASMVDLGTEFAVKTDALGNSLVRVHEGEISVSLLDAQGTSQISDILAAGGVLALNPYDVTPLQPGSDSDVFSRVPAMSSAALEFGEAYEAAVLASRPLIYWRFDQLDDEGCVVDLGSLGCRGRLINLGPREALTVDGGRLNLTPSPRLRRVISDRDLPGINSEELTVEVWIQSSIVAWQTIFGLTTAQSSGDQTSAAVLELAHESPLVHGPMAFRALSRIPPGKTGGTNLLADDLWMPGAWHHVVMVRGRERLQLFVDGRPVRETESPTAEDDLAYRVVLGQLRAPLTKRKFPDIRQFVGALDEFALYDRALDADEIRRHFQAAVPPVSESAAGQ